MRNEDLGINHDLLLRAEHGIEGVTACFQCASNPLPLISRERELMFPS